MSKLQSDQRSTKQIRIDAELHQKLLKVKAARARTSIKTLLEEYLADLLAVEKSKHDN